MNENIISKSSRQNIQFRTFMRSLHIIALLQHSVENEKMNYTSIANLFSNLPWDSASEPKTVKGCVENLNKMGFDIETNQGCDRITFNPVLTSDMTVEILSYYINVVADTAGIRDSFKSYVKTHGPASLWIVSRIYFASLEKKEVKLTYSSERNKEPEVYRILPCHWVYRDSFLYLIARHKGMGNKLFKFNRISKAEITDIRFDEDPPDASELLKHSMGAFIGSEKHEVTLEFGKSLQYRIEEDFGHLELNFSETPSADKIRVSFTVCDLINVCKAVFSYGGKVVIVSSDAAIKEMKRLLEDNLTHYK